MATIYHLQLEMEMFYDHIIINKSSCGSYQTLSSAYLINALTIISQSPLGHDNKGLHTSFLTSTVHQVFPQIV